MNRTIIAILLLFSINLFSQELTEKVGDIEVQLIWHYLKRNSSDEPISKKTNRKNRPHKKLYFNSNGILLKQIGFGKHHNTDLRITDYIEIYNYNGDKLSEVIYYESDYQKRIYPYWKTTFVYNQEKKLIEKSTYNLRKESLLEKITYEYKDNVKKSFLDSTYYYERVYDSLKRLSSLKQVYDNELRWEWKYTYSDKKRIGIFQTHYNDGEDYSKNEILTYSKGKVIECEDIYISNKGWNEKTKIDYFDNGIIKRIENYEMIGESNEYQLISFTEIKVKSKSKITEKVSTSINEQIEY